MHRSARIETDCRSISRNRLSVVTQLMSATASARWSYSASPVPRLVSGILASSASRATELQPQQQQEEDTCSNQGAVNVPSRCGQGTTVANVLSKAGGSSLISVSMVSVA